MTPTGHPFVPTPPRASIAQDQIQFMQAQISDLKKLIISYGKQLVYVLPILRRGDDSQTRNHDAEESDEQIYKEVYN